MSSKESKQQAEVIKKVFETVKEGSKKYIDQSTKFDKDLADKIKKVQQGADEVVKHIEKKSS